MVGKVLVCEREPPGYNAVAIKKENSARLIFAHKATRENILTAKITQTTVVRKVKYIHATQQGHTQDKLTS